MVHICNCGMGHSKFEDAGTSYHVALDETCGADLYFQRTVSYGPGGTDLFEVQLFCLSTTPKFWTDIDMNLALFISLGHKFVYLQNWL